MNKEDIKTINAYISLNPGDCIIDSLGKIEEVAYIDYVAKMVVAIAVARESLIGDLSFRSRATIITFDDIICHYQKTVDYHMGDTDTIKTTNGDLSIKAGDAIVNNGRVLEVTGVAYDSCIVDINENGDKYAISLADIESVERIDSVTQIATIGSSKNRLIIITNGFNSHSSIKEVKDDCVSVGDNSPKIGDEITGAEGNKYKVVCIDYNDCEVTVRSTDGEEITFNLDGFDSSVYKKVLK